MNWLRKLLGICQHKWRIVNEVEVVDYDFPDKRLGSKFILQCEHCGNLKFKRTF